MTLRSRGARPTPTPGSLASANTSTGPELADRVTSRRFASVARDWVDWHRAYDDTASALSRRLAVISRMIRDVLDSAPPGDIRVVSLCAGDGRDLIGAATGHPRAADLEGVLVELDAQLAATAAVGVASVSNRVTVLNGDAGVTAGFRAALPVDLLLLCGIFGNLSDEDVRTTIAAVPAMTRAGATVIWTRHRREPDLTPSIRRWFDDAGCTSMELVSPGAGGFAIGAERRRDVPASGLLPDRLFSFRDDLW